MGSLPLAPPGKPRQNMGINYLNVHTTATFLVKARVNVHLFMSYPSIFPGILQLESSRLGGRGQGDSWDIVYVCAQLLQLCLTLFDPMDCSLPGSAMVINTPASHCGPSSHVWRKLFHTHLKSHKEERTILWCKVKSLFYLKIFLRGL